MPLISFCGKNSINFKPLYTSNFFSNKLEEIKTPLDQTFTTSPLENDLFKNAFLIKCEIIGFIFQLERIIKIKLSVSSRTSPNPNSTQNSFLLLSNFTSR